MIKPEDLRIGNWLLYEGKPVQVESIDPLRELPERDLKCSVQIKEWITDQHYTFTGKWLIRFEPIQLTPEWWGKMGYEKYDDMYYGTESYLKNLGPIAFVYQSQWCMGGLPLAAKNIKYVHEFQNLIYALTAKELVIK